MSSGDSTVVAAPVLWAQRKDRIYLTICLEDVQEKQLDLTETRLTFSGVGGTGKKPHAVTIEFFKEVDPQESRNLATGREIVMSIKKKESGPYWPRLTADSVKKHWLKTDFNRWVDEDEVDSRLGFGGGAEDDNFEAMMSQMGGGFDGGGFGGGGFGGDDGLDLKDDELGGEGSDGEEADKEEEEDEAEATSAKGEGESADKSAAEDGQAAPPLAAAE